MVIAGFVARFYAISYWGFGLMFAAVALSILFVLLLGNIDQKLGRIAETEQPEEETGLHSCELVVRQDGAELFRMTVKAFAPEKGA